MKNHTSQDAFYERLRNLAEANKKSVKEPQTRNLGTLIDYKRAADNIAYGIIKENHNYYIKKAGIKNDPDASDFAYIGGLANVTNFQYKTFAEADKQRNMLLHTVSEASNQKQNPNGSKKRLNEDKAGEEIGNAEQKLGDLDAATAAEETPVANEPTPDEMAAGIDSEPVAPEGNEAPAEMPVPDQSDAEIGGEETPAPEDDGNVPAPEDGEETPAPEGEETPAPEGGEGDVNDEIKELEKSIGKITNKIRKTELEPAQIKSYVNSFLSAFKDKFPELEIEDRKEMANRILKVVPPEDMEELGQDVENTTGEEGLEEEVCAECGSFAKYAESRGYNSAEALMECGEEEATNLVSGYANAHNDGMNDGDLENVAVVIKIINPKMLNTLQSEYGHDDYAEKLEPIVNNMNECSQEEGVVKLQELFGGLGNLGKTALKGVGSGLKSAGQAIGGAVQKGAQAVGQAAKGVQQAYHAGEVPAEVKKLEGLANDLGKQIASLNSRLTKAGKQPVNTKSILTTIQNQVGTGKVATLTGKAGLAEEGFDPANVETQPNITFGSDSQSLGAGVVKPDGAPTTVAESKKPSAGLSKEKKSEIVKKAKKGEDIGKKGKGFKEVEKAATKEYGSKEKGEKVAAAAMWKNVKREGVEEVEEVMTEGEIKLRNYIRDFLQVRRGEKKATINEEVKSPKLKKLDGMINEQIGILKESEIKNVDQVNEILGFSVKEKLAKTKPNDAAGVDSLFQSAFKNILINPKLGAIGRAAKNLSTQEKYNLVKQFANNDGGTLRLDNSGKVSFASKGLQDKQTKSDFVQGGTQGHTAFGGV